MARRWRNRWLELSDHCVPVIERLKDSERADDGERTVCIDEMTGIQAIERKEKDLPLRHSCT